MTAWERKALYDPNRDDWVYLNDQRERKRDSIPGGAFSPESLPRAGRKDDSQKDPWQLLPWDALRGIVKVLAFGANKYDARNWEKGMEWDRVWRAAIEHLTEWFQHGKPDPETGYSHLWHAGCCVLFLIAYEIRGIGTDNRPGKSSKGE